MATAPDSTKLDPGPNRERVELILAQIEQLPTLPAVATRLLEVTTSPDTSARDIVKILETDQALTSKVLSLVRRAHLGVRGDVITIQQAVVLLGFEAIRNAVLSIQIYETFASMEPHDETDFDRSEFWKHSLAVACAAQMIGEKIGGPRLGSEAFVCGLLHDVGKAALDACLPKSYARVVHRTRRRHRCICDVEREVLGLDHTIAGKRLLTRWKLPGVIIESAWLHHQPPQALPASVESASLLKIVYLADNLARHQRIGFSGYNRIDPPAELAERVGLSAEDLADVTSALAARIEEHCQLVGLEKLTSTTIYAEALAEANEELGRVNASLAETNRRLTLRSRYFDALRAFLSGLSLDDRPADVCQTAARCMGDLMGCDRAVAFCAGPGDRTWHVGAVGGEPRATEMIIPRPPPPEAGASPEAAGAGGGRIVPAPEWSRVIRERFTGFPGRDAVWMLPFVHFGRVVGGVLFCAAADEVERHNQAPTEVEALCGAFGLAAATARAGSDSQRLSEELAEVNRRLHCAQAELLRSRSLSMIAQMAAGAAHELNNPLAVISGRSQMLAREAEDDLKRRGLQIIREQSQRASRIVTELMEFAKPDPPRATDVVVGRWAESLRRRWLERSSLEPEQIAVRISDPGVTVRVDPGQLEQIFEAIVRNAIEAMSQREPRLVINSTSAASDDTVVVAVEDNGTGMTPDVLEHALDPFFSYRSAGRNRGLGLSRAARLAENNGGRLWLESTSGIGTTVSVELPAGQPA